MTTVKMKSLFFDRRAVTRAISKAKRSALSKGGAFIRSDARKSMRRAPYATRKPRGQKRTDFSRKRVYSKPGNPPFARENPFVKKFLWFAFDPQSESVVVGPAKLVRSTDAPTTLEFGGRVTVKTREFPLRTAKEGTGRRLTASARRDIESRKRRSERRRVKKKATVLPRPFMFPALMKNLQHLPRAWRNAVVKGGA